MSAELIKALQDPALYPHDIREFRVIETHISWVLLTGDYAYKIKKPVDFGFLDFTTLGSRAFYCSEELRLNRRLAPELYLDRVRITGSATAPFLHLTENGATTAGDADVLEYAVRMRQFDAGSVLGDADLGEDELETLLLGLMESLAQFHRTECVAVALDQPWGHPEQVMEPVRQNFEQILPLLDSEEERSQLAQISEWAEHTFGTLYDLMEDRRRDGRIRECHGDLHLGNIARIQDRAVPFDCIEFNESFRWIDVMNDVSFLAMDLDDRGMEGLSHRILNRYLEVSGDYRGTELLAFYKCYRAMVRCKIALFTLQSPNQSKEEQDNLVRRYRNYLELAVRYTEQSPPFLVLMQGLSGSGKSTAASQIVSLTGAIRIRSDVERKRLAGLAAQARTGSPTAGGIYTPDMNRLTYEHLQDLSAVLLRAGHSVVVDATFLKEEDRRAFSELADQQNVRFLIAACSVAEATAQRWLKQRAIAGTDAAEADYDIMLTQRKSAEAFTREEQEFVIAIRPDLPEQDWMSHLLRRLTS